MSEPSKAVFLSYASQDTEAAKRLADALRSAGVEVWFDQEGGLEHGDEWDAKIRRQIKECVLFIPVISASTQARHEGYFRIEWELAAQRAMGIASGVPFILPVVIDGTREPDALVPDRFRTVQWTKLAGGQVAPDVLQRFLKLWSHRTGVLKHEAARAGVAPVAAGPSAAETVGRPGAKPYAFIAVALAVVVAGIGWWLLAGKSRSVAAPPAAGTAAPQSEAGQLTARVLAITEKVGFTREELGVAEDLARRATELESDSAGAWGVRAGVAMSWMNRNWDNSEKRRQEVQALANRALALDPNEPEALLAIGHLLRKQGAYEQASAHLRRAVAVNPGHIPLVRALGFSLRMAGHREEARAVLQAATLRAPRDPLLRYDLAMAYADFGPDGADPANLAESLKQLDEAQAIQPFSTALIVKAVHLAGWRGDFAGMRAILDQLDQMPLTVRSEDRSVCVAMWAGLIEHRPDRVEAAALLTARDYFEDRLMPMRPKAWSLALAHRLAGKEILARADWQAAETVMRARLREDPANEVFKAELAITLAWLDQPAEAARLIGEMEPLWREQPLPARTRLLALYYAALGDAKRAAPYLAAALDGDVFTTRHTVPLDPMWDKLRGQPEFEAQLAKFRAGGVPNPGSVAPAPAAAAAPLSDARQLAAKARALFESLDGTRDDYKLAEELMAQAKAKDGLDAEVCAAEAQLHERFLQRGWDTSDARREAARAAAQRAIRLDPRSFEARWAQAGLLAYTGSEGEEKERQLRELRRERPTDQRVLRTLGTCLDRLGRLEDAVAILDESAALPGGDPLALYTKSQIYWWAGRTAEAEAAIEASIAQKPFTGALLMSVWYKARLRGDLDGARVLLNRINPAEMVEDRACWFAYYVEWLARRPDAAITRLAVVPRDWLNDNFHRGSKAALVGDAQQLAGRPDAAALEWRAALKLVDQRLAASPNDWRLLSQRLGLLARLGQREEAERSLGVLTQLLGSEPDVTAFVLSRVYTLLGRKAEAISQISAGLKRAKRAVQFTVADLRLNPDWDPLRGEPAFAAVIAEAEAIEKATALPGGGPAAPAAAATGPDPKSVAVLAFTNLSDDKGNEYFSDGISEELLTVLQKIPGLHVAARTSSFYFKGKEATAQEIGTKLGVANLVEGSVQKSGSRVKVTARLSRVATGEERWSESYTRELKDVFALQEELAVAILGELRGQLAGGESAATVKAAVRGGTKVPEAYQEHLQGKFFANRHSEKEMVQAQAHFQRAVELDPGFALAWAGLAQSHMWFCSFSTELGRVGFDNHLAKARVAVAQAMALEPEMAESLLAKSLIQLNVDFDWRAAGETLRKARAKAPTDPALLLATGNVAAAFGDNDEALACFRQAVAVDPVNPTARSFLALQLVTSGHYAEAEAEFPRVVALNSAAPWAHAGLALAYLLQHRYDDALAAARDESAEYAQLLIIACARWSQQRRPESDAALDRLVAIGAGTAAYQIAEIHAYRGDLDRAFEWLARARKQRDSGLIELELDPLFASLHSDPRWAAFRKELGLPAAQLK